MDREAGWWTTSGNVGLPPLARVMGVGRQQQQQDRDTLLQRIGEIYRKLCCINLEHYSSFKKIQTAENTALRAVTGTHKMASINHHHQESITLKVRDHPDMLSAQYLVNCLEEDHVWHGIASQEPRSMAMKDTLHSRHHSSVIPRLGASKQEKTLPEPAHIRGRFGHSAPRKQQSTERPSTLKGWRGEETEPETTMYSLTITIRTDCGA